MWTEEQNNKKRYQDKWNVLVTADGKSLTFIQSTVVELAGRVITIDDDVDDGMVTVSEACQ